MPDLTEQDLTFGFEAEFADNAEPLARRLYTAGLMQTERLHSYHCDCERCEITNGYELRAQQDSSCAGEIISAVFTTQDLQRFAEVCEEIQTAAFDVDAVPGSCAGFHVHVGGGPSPTDVAAGFVLAEAALMDAVSPGALRNQRDFNQSSALAMLSHYNRIISDYGLERAEEQTRNAINAAWTTDRHSNLWHSGRYGTNEFRLWNSTASAWRMEMFVRCSLAMSTPLFLEGTTEEVTADLAQWGKSDRGRRFRLLDDFWQTQKWPGSWTVRRLVEQIALVDDRAAELLERQIAFHSKNKDTLPTTSPNGDQYAGVLSGQQEQDDPIGATLDPEPMLVRSLFGGACTTLHPNAVYTIRAGTLASADLRDAWVNCDAIDPPEDDEGEDTWLPEF